MNATNGENAAGQERARERLAQAIYEVLFDPRCDTEGAVWDDASRFAEEVAEAIGPDDLDALVSQDAKDADAVYYFAKAAVRADRANLPPHRDIVWNDWTANVQRRVGWLKDGLPYDAPLFSSIEVVTDLHDGQDCPFLDGEELAMEQSEGPLVIPSPSGSGGSE